MSLFYDYFKRHPTTELLRVLYWSADGNLLEGSDPTTAEAQIECFRWLLSTRRPRNFLEIGTNKAYLSWLIKLMELPVKVVTIDVNNECSCNAEVAGAEFICGQSAGIVPSLAGRHFDMAYIDGDHTTEGCSIDIENCVGLGIPCIAIDDTKAIWQVMDAVKQFNWQRYGYSIVFHPFWWHDSRGILIYERKGDNGLSDLL